MPLELAFANKTIRRVCENQASASRELGVEVADSLRRRLADLRAAPNVKDVIAGSPRENDSNSQSHFTVDLANGVRLVFCANHNSTPMLKTGTVDWAKVSRVKILKIENNHG